MLRKSFLSGRKRQRENLIDEFDTGRQLRIQNPTQIPIPATYTIDMLYSGAQRNRQPDTSLCHTQRETAAPHESSLLCRCQCAYWPASPSHAYHFPGQPPQTPLVSASLPPQHNSLMVVISVDQSPKLPSGPKVMDMDGKKSML